MKKYKYKLKGGYHPSPEVSVELAKWDVVKPFGNTQPLDGGAYNTDTMRFYKNGETIIVVIRGTRNLDDVAADLTIKSNKLNTTERYKTDEQKLKEVQMQYPYSKYGYYGVAHSLGGAIMDRFLEKGLLNNGISFNPAVEPKNYTNPSGLNQRVYNKNDIVYNWFGKNIKPDTYKEQHGTPKLGREVEPIILEDNQMGPLKSLLAHKMDSFNPKQVANALPQSPRALPPLPQSPQPSPKALPQALPQALPKEVEVKSGEGKYKFSEPDTYIYLY
jgi:hypothetical protein